MKGVTDMIKKLILISVLLLVCIVMMVVALFIDEQTFGQISGYFSLASVVISLLGVLMILRKNKSK